MNRNQLREVTTKSTGAGTRSLRKRALRALACPSGMVLGAANYTAMTICYALLIAFPHERLVYVGLAVTHLCQTALYWWKVRETYLPIAPDPESQLTERSADTGTPNDAEAAAPESADGPRNDPIAHVPTAPAG